MTPQKHPLNQLGKDIESVVGMTPADRQERIDITKIALREVINEWLDDRLREVGKWTARGLALAAFAALVYFILSHGGWTHK